MSTASSVEKAVVMEIVDGLKKTIEKLKKEKSALEKENHKLRRDLGILEEEGFLERPSLPAIVYDYVSPPRCEKHGATLSYDNGYWRCEECKTSIKLVKP